MYMSSVKSQRSLWAMLFYTVSSFQGAGVPMAKACAVLRHGSQDLENTTGSWDMYGQEDKKRYPDLQNKFFSQSAEFLTRREALRGFIALCEYGHTCLHSRSGLYASVRVEMGVGPGGCIWLFARSADIYTHGDHLPVIELHATERTREDMAGTQASCLPLFHAVGVGAIATFGLKGAKDADLPITKGPQTSGENGKGGSVRARI